MSVKTVHLLGQDGAYIGDYFAQENPEEPGTFIEPIASTDVPLPAVPEAHYAQFDGAQWSLLPIPVPPEFEAPTPPTLEEVKEQAKAMVRAARKPVFYTLAGMQSEALAMGDGATATSIVAIQQALRDLPGTDLSACTNAAEVDAVFVAAWLALAQSAPANVVSAFNEVLA